MTTKGKPWRFATLADAERARRILRGGGWRLQLFPGARGGWFLAVALDGERVRLLRRNGRIA